MKQVTFELKNYKIKPLPAVLPLAPTSKTGFPDNGVATPLIITVFVSGSIAPNIWAAASARSWSVASSSLSIAYVITALPALKKETRLLQ